LTYGLLPYLVPVEEALSSLLPRPQRVRANVSAVLRSDLSTRYESYQTALAAGFLTVDEVRALEDLEPLPESSPAAPMPDAVPSPTEFP
jgi:phage portal protein BeeE